MMANRNVYLDNSATTRPSDAVVSAMLRVLTENWHNPSALYQPAMQAEKLMSAARDTCLKAAGAAGHTLVFTAGGTEGNNWAMQAARGRHAVVSAIEHASVLEAAKAFADAVTLVQPDEKLLWLLLAQLGERGICYNGYLLHLGIAR